MSTTGTEPAEIDPAAETPEEHAAEGVSELEAARREASDNWDKYLRAVAETDNVRKRSARDVENAHKFATERFATDLLPVADSLTMALDAATRSGQTELATGTEATLKLLLQAFERHGIGVVDPLGEPFDPQLHEAMTMAPAPAAEPGSVIEVVQRGYTLNGRLLRPARVVVAAEPG